MAIAELLGSDWPAYITNAMLAIEGNKPDDDEVFGEAFYRCSYLAKARGKGYGSLGANNYSGSRVRFKSRTN